MKTLNVLRTRFRCRFDAPLIVPYHENRLNEGDRRRVDVHLASCADCTQSLAALSTMHRLLRDSSATTSHVDLWPNIEAEILKSGGAARRGIKAPRRPAFGFDSLWPNAVPVAAAVFSAIVFGFAIVNMHHGIPTTAAPITETAVTVTLRPMPSVGTRARLNPAMPVRLAAIIRVKPVRPHTAMVARRAPVVLVSLARVRHSAFSLAGALRARSSSVGTASANPPYGTLLAAAAPPPAESPALREAAPPDPDAVPAAAMSAPAPASAETPVNHASRTATLAAYRPPSEEDATVRDAPAAAPMSDLAFFSRRQYGLFSYGDR
jgi:hypothetical protein